MLSMWLLLISFLMQQAGNNSSNLNTGFQAVLFHNSECYSVVCYSIIIMHGIYLPA
jgi:hypothetical protein